jgi:glycine/D-amino acid oxidase-like deaminating enzyme
MPKQGLPTTYSFVQETGYEYMISRPPAAGDDKVGDIVIGGGIWKLGKEKSATRYGETDDTVIDPTIRDYLRESCVDYFSSANWGEDDPKGRVKKEWSGVMGASADGLPYVGMIPEMPGLWISASFNGHGMVWCVKAAEALVDRMVGDEEMMRKLDSWFPKCAWISKERMKVQFKGRTDLKAPEERIVANMHVNGYS